MIYQDEFGEALSPLDRGLIRAAPLVTHRFPLDQIQDAFAAHRSCDSIKVALFP